MAEPETTTVIPSGIVDHLGTQGFHDSGRHGNAIAAEDIVVVNRILRHHFVHVASRVNGCADIAHVNGLAVSDITAHHVHPL